MTAAFRRKFFTILTSILGIAIITTHFQNCSSTSPLTIGSSSGNNNSASGVTCSVFGATYDNPTGSASTLTIASNARVFFSILSSPPGFVAYWYGTNPDNTQVNTPITGTTPTTFQAVVPTGTYQRYVQLFATSSAHDQGLAPVCTSASAPMILTAISQPQSQTWKLNQAMGSTGPSTAPTGTYFQWNFEYNALFGQSPAIPSGTNQASIVSVGTYCAAVGANCAQVQ